MAQLKRKCESKKTQLIRMFKKLKNQENDIAMKV